MPFILQDGRLIEVTDAQFAAYTGIETPTIRTTAAERRARAAAEATPAGGQLIQATDTAAPANNQEIINPNTTNTTAGQTLTPVPAPLNTTGGTTTQITQVPPIPGLERPRGFRTDEISFTREELNAAGITNIPPGTPLVASRPAPTPVASTVGQPTPTPVTDGVDQVIPVPVTDGVDTLIPRSNLAADQVPEEQAARSPLGIGGNYTTSFNPETGTYDVVNLDNGQVVESGLSELNAQVTASQFSQGDPQFETPELPPDLPDLTEPEVPGGNFGSVFDPETQSWSIVDRDTGQIVQTGFTSEASAELQAQLDSQPDPYVNQFTDDDINESFAESDLIREPTAQDVIDADPRFAGENVGSVLEAPAIVTESEVLPGFTADDRAAGENVGSVLVAPAPVGLTESEVVPGFTADPRAAGENVGSVLDTPAVVTDAARNRAQVQATLANQQRQADSGDWRFKIRLAPGARYLYRGDNGQGVQSGILAPLAVTDGVIFPYTPQVNTSYVARYSETDLPHSNYRGYFYNNSHAEAVSIEGVFTAQDTAEANYLLAVIHFFRSATKMFYGQDDTFRGAPPPLVFLQGFGAYQFSRHPCVISNFRYTLPRDVDYIRADVQPITGLNIQQQRRPGGVPPQSLPTNVFTGALARLAAAGVPKGAVYRAPPVDTLGTKSPTYVPTRMDITIEVLPMQTRQQVSQEFTMRDFASGALLKKGFW